MKRKEQKHKEAKLTLCYAVMRGGAAAQSAYNSEAGYPIINKYSAPFSMFSDS